MLEENEFSKSYSEESLFDKFKKYAQKAGISVVYAALLLYYLLQEHDVPVRAKGTIMSALGYFIFPLDFIPDLTPVSGYVDDSGALIVALVVVATYINDDVKTKAKNKGRVHWRGVI